TIFPFQGASLDNFFYFKKLYTGASLIALTEGYRSGQKILDASHSMIQKDGVEGRIPLVSRAGVSHDVVAVHALGSLEAERAYVVAAVQARIAEGVEPSEIAVLYRTNGEAEQWVRAFEDRGVFVSVESEQNALKDPDIRKFLIYLTGIARLGDDTSMGELLHVPFSGVGPLDTYKIIHYARRSRRSIADILGHRELLSDAKVEQVDEALALYQKLVRFAKAPGSVPMVVGDIIRDSGYLTHILTSPRAVELIEKLAGFTRDIEKLSIGQADYSLTKLLAHLLLLDEYRIPITKEVRAAPRKGAVRLMTAHKSKGLEFDYVYIVNAVDGHWGGRRTREYFSLPTGGVDGDDNDERRLLYVALTRARISISLSYAYEKDGKGYLPTRFIEEIDPTLVTAEVHEAPHDHAADLARMPAQAHVSLPDKAFLNELFLEQGLSVTALNNYLSCPWRYFYSNLIRIPMAPTNALLYGNAIDRALKRFFEKYREEGTAELEILLTLYRESVLRQPLPEKDIADMERRGVQHLTAWFTEWHPTFVRETLSGYAIRTELALTGELPRVLLRGELDKVEFLADGSVRVVDYKTGKPKSRNAIMGKTKSDDGEYFRQLTFYRLLLSLEGKYRMHEGMLDFIQPDDRAHMHREVFQSDELDIDALQKEIEVASQDIWSLGFWDRFCDEKDCTYCPLRKMMQ
ncbi:MAG: ATP-dependent helicase, partial [Candidatus Pacebacteria bacterium]|nr:ATP-dependent helicase [Candidatus Paceibacterota bacterium]